MQILATPHTVPLPWQHRRPAPAATAPPAQSWSAMVLAFRSRDSNQALLQAWSGYLGTEASALSGVFELGRNQRLGRVSVDDSGALSVSGGTQTTTTVAVCGTAGTAVCSATSQSGPGGLRVAGGRILLPDGSAIPFGNRGVIVRLPDGSQVAVGRDGDGPAAKACRWVVAGPGERIPTSPPGATNVYDWDGAGKLSLAGQV